MEWFRFYNGAINDRKVQQLPAELFKAWVNILCLASATDKGGELPALEDIAFALRMDDERARSTLEALEQAGLIDRDQAGRLSPHNWHGRQRKSDDVAQRVQDHRNRKRDKAGNGPRNTPPAGPSNRGGNTPCNVTGNGTVTPHAGAHAGEREQIQRDTERERDAGAKAQLQSKPTVPDDDPVVDRPRETQSLEGPIGQNSAEAVKEALTAARQVDPEGVLELRLPYWLTKFPARFVTESIWKGKGKGTPSSYVARIIDRGLPPGWAEREAAASKPPKLRPEDVILRAPDYVREAAMARMKRNVS